MATVSSASNHFPTAQEGFSTATSGTTAAGATTVGLNSVSGYANGEVVTLVIDPTDSTKKQVFTGVVDTSGIQITGVVWTEGTNQTHSSGATVVDYETATAWALQAKGLLVEHSQSGIHKLTQLVDTNGNEFLKLAQVASAVNEITIANAATGNGPTISATGGDTNIDINLAPKATGKLKVGGVPVDTGAYTSWTPTFANFTIGNGTITFAKYIQQGKKVSFKLKVALGSTSSMGLAPTFTLPVTAASMTVADMIPGSVALLDASTGDTFAGGIFYSSTTTARFTYQNVNAIHQNIDTTAPVTWTTSDEFHVAGSYEAA